MKKIILSLIFVTSVIASFGQVGSAAFSSVFTRVVTDSAAHISASATRHGQNYGDFFWNAQAATPHWDFYNGSGYDHVFSFGGGSGSTPTLQQVLDAGSVLSNNVIIDGTGTNPTLEITDMGHIDIGNLGHINIVAGSGFVAESGTTRLGQTSGGNVTTTTGGTVATYGDRNVSVGTDVTLTRGSGQIKLPGTLPALDTAAYVLAIKNSDKSVVRRAVSSISGGGGGPVLASDVENVYRILTADGATVQTDNNNVIIFDSSSPIDLTIDNLILDTKIELVNKGTDDVNFVDDTGVTSEGASVLAPGETGTILYISSTAPIITVSGVGADAFESPITTEGDLIYGTTGGAAARLPISTAGKVLRVSAGLIPEWGDGLSGTVSTGQVLVGTGTNTAAGSADLTMSTTSLTLTKSSSSGSYLIADNTSTATGSFVYGINDADYQTYIGTKATANGYLPNSGLLYSNAPNGLSISANNSGSLYFRVGFADLSRLTIDYLGNIQMPSLVSGSALAYKNIVVDQYGNTSVQAIAQNVLNTNTSQTTNSGTTETDLYNYDVPANTLVVDGESVESKLSGTFTSSANDKRIRVYFEGSTIFDSGNFVLSSGTNYWTLEIQIIRTGAATQKCNVKLSTNNSTAYNMISYSAGAATMNLNNNLIVTVQASAGTNEVIKETAKTVVVR